MNAAQIIRAAIPEADAGIIDYIMWARTPWPAGSLTAKSLYRAASSAKRAAANNIELCDFCDNRSTGKWCCDKCRRILNRQLGEAS